MSTMSRPSASDQCQFIFDASVTVTGHLHKLEVINMIFKWASVLRENGKRCEKCKLLTCYLKDSFVPDHESIRK